jgi:hypothetical protein
MWIEDKVKGKIKKGKKRGMGGGIVLSCSSWLADLIDV